MRKRNPNLTGRRFGHLVAVSKIGPYVGRHPQWICRCDCGNVLAVRKENLVSGNSTTCGCEEGEQRRNRSITHGASKTKAYRKWMSMKIRCLLPKHSAYHSYGGRGIRICERWMKFENFLADMGQPLPGQELDRIDVNGNYEPGNCRWVSHEENCQNKRNNIYIEWQGRKQPISSWAKELGISHSCLYYRLMKKKYPLWKAMSGENYSGKRVDVVEILGGEVLSK